MRAHPGIGQYIHPEPAPQHDEESAADDEQLRTGGEIETTIEKNR
jgi:hypothetical protein